MVVCRRRDPTRRSPSGHVAASRRHPAASQRRVRSAHGRTRIPIRARRARERAVVRRAVPHRPGAGVSRRDRAARARSGRLLAAERLPRARRPRRGARARAAAVRALDQRRRGWPQAGARARRGLRAQRRAAAGHVRLQRRAHVEVRTHARRARGGGHRRPGPQRQRRIRLPDGATVAAADRCAVRARRSALDRPRLADRRRHELRAHARRREHGRVLRRPRRHRHPRAHPRRRATDASRLDAACAGATRRPRGTRPLHRHDRRRQRRGEHERARPVARRADRRVVGVLVGAAVALRRDVAGDRSVGPVPRHAGDGELGRRSTTRR